MCLFGALLKVYSASSTLIGFLKGFLWDIPILIFAYVLFGGPKRSQCAAMVQAYEEDVATPET